jgi:phospholipase A1
MHPVLGLPGRCHAPRRRPAPRVRALLGVALLSALHGVAEAGAQGLAEALGRCAGLEAAEARLACYDALAARSATPVQPPPQPPRPAPAPAQTEPVETAAAGEPAPPTDADQKTAAAREWFSIRPYRANYILPFTYNANPNRDFPEESAGLPFLGDAFDNVEMKFQLSLEVPVWRDILDQDLDLYFAYTQLSFFQAYNREYSSPFRETNYEPEFGLNWHPDLPFLGWRLTSTRLALNHQSNGRTEPLSRSWNRLIGQIQVERDDLALALRVWKRFNEDVGSDDNPDITDYLGHGELHLGYDLGKHHLGLMVRNPIEHAAVQLDWSYPLGEVVQLYVQYFNGYGEGLLDYDHSVNRVGIGFLLNDWP